MKLNNRGWGISNFIILIILLMAFLVMVGFLINDLIKNFETNPQVNSQTLETYKNYEKNIAEQTKKYIKDYYPDYNIEDGVITASVSTLKTLKYIDNLTDPVSEIDCSGYGWALYKDSSYEYKGFIKCGNHYETDGYDDRFDL